MKNSTPWLGRLLGSLLAVSFLGTAVQAQTAAPAGRVINPEDTDPGYAARKARRAGPQGPHAPAPRQAGPAAPRLLPSCFEPLDATYTALPGNDDGSTPRITLPFAFSLFGTSYTSCFVNNNGNISFNNSVGAFSSTGFPAPDPMVAAFWGDVDTSVPGSGLCYYKVFPDRLVVTWDRVYYFGSRGSALNNTFQLVIRRNTGGFSPSPDVSLAYGDMQWTTGGASGGTNGFGGIPATVGINQGGGASNFIQTGRFNLNDSTPPRASYPAGTVSYSGVNWLDDQCIDYTIAPAGNLPPSATGFPAGNTVTLAVGQTVTLAFQFAGPEIGQAVTVTPNLAGLCNAASRVGLGASPIVTFAVTGAACNLGTRTVNFVATDNGTPVESRTFPLTVVVTAAAQWSGAVSTAYDLPGNWVGNAVPGAAVNVAIPAGVPNFPVLTTSASAADFTVASGASMTIAAGGDLSLSGTIGNAGTFVGTAGTLRTTGSASQTFGGSGSYALGELVVGSNNAQLASAMSIAKVLTLNGNLTTNGQPLRLLSNASGTAMVVNNGAAVVDGNATVQRYLDPSRNAGLGYRHFAAPVAGATVANLSRAGFPAVVNPAYNAVGNTVRPFPTVFGYDQLRVTTSGNPGSEDFDRGFFSPTATTEVMAAAKGYTANLPTFDLSSGPIPLPVLFTGALHNGPYSSGALPRGTQAESGWHLLGNPYPAPIDWNSAVASATGLDNAVYVFKSTGQYAGTYESYVNGVGPARYIGVAQGFFVRTATPGTSGQLNLTNAARVTTYQNPSFQRVAAGTGPGDQRPQLRLDLESNGQQDAAYVYFEAGATAGFDARYDAHKLPGGNPLYLATGTGGLPFSINGQPALAAAGAALPLLTYLPQAGSFTLRVGDLQHFGAATLHLEDRQTGTWHDLRQQPAVSFSATRPDEAATRFVLHVNQSRALATAAAKLAADAVSVWPNPATGLVRLHVTALPPAPDQLHVTLLNPLGQVVAHQAVPVQAGAATAAFDVRALAPGVYTLRGSTRGHTFARSVVVQ